MISLARPFALALAICAAPLTVAAAQEALMPEPIAADAPTAKQGRAVAELVLAGDRAKLEAFLKENAAPSYIESAAYATELTQVLEAAKTGARTIVRLDGLGKVGVGVALGTDASAAPERAIVVRMDPAAPHRITGLQLVRIQIG